MKVILVGPDSVHIRRFYQNMKGRDVVFKLIAEEPVNWFDGTEFNYSFRSNNPFLLWKNYNAVRNLLRKEKPEIVHIHQINRLAVIVGAAAKKEGIKVIDTAWGSDVLLVPKRNKFFAMLTKKALQKADMITADAHVMIESMKELHPRGNYHIWQYGIDPIETNVAKEKIIYSNRMHEPLYRIDKVVDYFADFYKYNKEWKLVIGGNGSLTTDIKAKVKSLDISDAVNFVGYSDAKQNADYYAKSAIFISIPNSDGTSVSLMEAMSAGCIPIVSDLEVNRDWITNNNNGIIESGDVNPIGEAIKLNGSEVAVLNKKITDAISRDKMGDEMMNFYRKLAKA